MTALRFGYAHHRARPRVGFAASIQEKLGTSAAAISSGGHCTSIQLHSIAPLIRR